MPLILQTSLNAQGINKWVCLNDETQMMEEWPQLIECFGLEALKTWRAPLRKHSPALVHEQVGWMARRSGHSCLLPTDCPHARPHPHWIK